jgi:hypothetical protein
MHPVAFEAFVDEMEKIAISMQLAEKATEAAWRKGLTGSRTLSAKAVRGFDPTIPTDSTQHILGMAGRKTKGINPLLHPIERAKAEMSLLRMREGAGHSAKAREWTAANPGKTPSQNPHVRQPGQRYAGFDNRGEYTFTVDSPGGREVPLSGKHRTGPSSHGRHYEAMYAQEDAALDAHRATLAARPPEAPFSPARAALLQRRAQANAAMGARIRSAAVPQKPAPTATPMPTQFPPMPTAMPTAQPGTTPTPAAPMQRRPFISRTPQVRPQQPGVVF